MKKIIIALCLSFLVSSFGSSALVYAADPIVPPTPIGPGVPPTPIGPKVPTTPIGPAVPPKTPQCGGGGVAGFLGFRGWDSCLEKDANGVPQIKSLEDIWKVAILVVEFFVKVSGYLAVGFIVWGGIKYLKSQGEPGETAQARQIITNALMGLVLCIMSVAIIQFITGIFK